MKIAEEVFRYSSIHFKNNSFIEVYFTTYEKMQIYKREFVHKKRLTTFRMSIHHKTNFTPSLLWNVL